MVGGRRGDPNHPAFDVQLRRVFSSYVFAGYNE